MRIFVFLYLDGAQTYRHCLAVVIAEQWCEVVVSCLT
jgi:hypothetical protein